MFKVMFCSVRGFRVRVWESCRTSRSLRYGYGCVTELTEVPGVCGAGVQNLQKFRAGIKWLCTRTPGIVARSYRSYRSSGYGYECRTNLTEVPGTGNTRVNTRQRVRFEVKDFIQLAWHVLLGQRPRGNT